LFFIHAWVKDKNGMVMNYAIALVCFGIQPVKEPTHQKILLIGFRWQYN